MTDKELLNMIKQLPSDYELKWLRNDGKVVFSKVNEEGLKDIQNSDNFVKIVELKDTRK